MFLNVLVLVLVVLLIFLIYYFIIYYEKKTTNDIVLEYILKNDIRSVYTLNKTNEGYLNAFYDENTDMWYEVETQQAYDKNGKVYKHKPHGEVMENSEGFEIVGIDYKFKCTPPFYWNGKECILTDICKDKHGYVRLPEYSFLGSAFHQLNAKPKYHEKLYVKCPDKTLHSCDQYQIVGPNEITPLSVNPCIYYDICENKGNGFTHNVPIKPLDLNSYFKCNFGKSQLIKCDKELIFDPNSLCCVENLCHPGDKQASDKVSYKLCNEQGHWDLVKCPWGVDKNSLVCLPDQSHLYPRFTFYNDFIGGIKSVEYLKPNTTDILFEIASDEEATYNFYSVWSDKKITITTYIYDLHPKDYFEKSRLSRLGFVLDSPLASINTKDGNVLLGCRYNTEYNRDFEATKLIPNTLIEYKISSETLILHNPITPTNGLKLEVVYLPCEFGILKLVLCCVASDGFVIQLKDGPKSVIHKGIWGNESVCFSMIKYSGVVFPLVNYFKVISTESSYKLEKKIWTNCESPDFIKTLVHEAYLLLPSNMIKSNTFEYINIENTSKMYYKD